MTATEPFEGLPEGVAVEDGLPGDGEASDDEEEQRGPAAIEVVDVSKRFRLFHERATFLKERVTGGTKAVVDDFWALKGVSVEIEA